MPGYGRVIANELSRHEIFNNVVSNDFHFNLNIDNDFMFVDTLLNCHEFYHVNDYIFIFNY